MKERKYLNLGKVGWGMFLASALALTSCVNDDEIDNSLQTTSKSIGFSTSYDNNAWEPDQISRGAQISSVNDNWGYKVGAYYHLPNDGGSYDYFDRHSGGFTVSKSTGTANTDYYWPPAGNMQFFAVAPHDAGINVPTLANILNGTKTLTYTIPGDVTEQKDIMVAETANIDCPQASAVGLNFQHLLAGIQFKVGDMEDIQINSLTINGVKGGAVTMTYDNTDANNPVWTYNSTTSTSYNVIYSTDGTPNVDTSNLSKGAIIAGHDNGLMLFVMPQTLSGATLTIDYTDVNSGTQKTNQSVDLTGTWQAGKITNYILTINPDYELKLTLEVAAWTNPGPIYSDYGNTTAVGENGSISWIKNIDGVDGDDLDYTVTTNTVTTGNTEITEKIVKLENKPDKKAAAFTFEIAAPLGGTWYALLETISGNSQAFTLSLLDDDGNQLKNDNGELLPCQGNVGTPGKVMVEVNGPNPYESGTNNKARLYFVVRLGGGQVLAVPGTELGEYFIQQDFEQKQQ